MRQGCGGVIAASGPCAKLVIRTIPLPSLLAKMLTNRLLLHPISGEAVFDLDVRLKTRPAATILVVEDEFLIRFLVATELRDLGFRVIEASNADEALGLLASGLR